MILNIALIGIIALCTMMLVACIAYRSIATNHKRRMDADFAKLRIELGLPPRDLTQWDRDPKGLASFIRLMNRCIVTCGATLVVIAITLGARLWG